MEDILEELRKRNKRYLESYVATATKQEQLEHQLENQLLRLLLQKDQEIKYE